MSSLTLVPNDDAPWAESDVWAQRRGSSNRELLGRVTIEPLDGVLTRMTAQQGANGPRGPLTQYLLREGAVRLASALTGIGDAEASSEGMTSFLSRLVGHERFVEDELDLSAHNMRRRWPLAGDWYADLVAYIMRPQRHEITARITSARLLAALTLPFGEFVSVFTALQLELSNDVMLFRLPETLEWLFPENPIVRESLSNYLSTLDTYWGPLYLGILDHYGLRLKDGATVQESVWSFMALFSWEGHNRAVLPQLPLVADPLGGRARAYSDRAACWYVCATCETTDGRALSFAELLELRPGLPPQVQQ